MNKSKRTTPRPRVTKKKRTSFSDNNLGIFSKEDEAVTTIYIGNMKFTKTPYEVRDLFTKYGKVTYVRLIMDKETEKSKGIAFVQMPNKKDALMAIEKLNQTQVDGRTLKVSIAIDNPAAKVARKPKKETIDLPIESIDQKPKKKKRDKGLKLLFNYLNQ